VRTVISSSHKPAIYSATQIAAQKVKYTSTALEKLSNGPSQPTKKPSILNRVRAKHRYNGKSMWLNNAGGWLHIHNAYCGHGGERVIAGALVDGYEPTTKTVFQYHECHWHGCPAHCKQTDATDRLNKTQQQQQK